MKYLTQYVPQRSGISDGYVAIEEAGVLKAQKLSFDGTTATPDGTAEVIDNVGLFATGMDEPAYEGGTNGGGSCKYYKCASVDTANNTWSGYELILQDGVYTVSETMTEGLTYVGFMPFADRIYSEDGMLEVSRFYEGFDLVSPTDMTSNENDDWLVSCSTYYMSNDAYNAFSGNIISPIPGWQSGGYQSPPHWIQWQNKKLKSRVMSYSIQASNNVPEDLTPNTWFLYGSNNGSDWVVVDERTNAISEAGNFETFTFTCQNPGSYYYYRLYITAPLPRSFALIGQIRAYGLFE